MKRCHLDANVVLRFLRNDDPKQSLAAKRLIESAKAGHVVLVLSAVTIAEVFYAFRASYKMSRPNAARHLGALLRSSVFELENETRVLDTLQHVEKLNVDFGDAYLAVTATESGDSIASFDQDFKKFPQIELYSL
jgi:predicted nucleic acid-binding protein